jgi:hypothetical protein
MASTRTSQSGSADAAGRPTLRVIRGDATEEEVAALVAVLAGMGAAPAPEAQARRSGWSDRRIGHRRGLTSGPGAWRLSAFSADNVRTRADW